MPMIFQAEIEELERELGHFLSSPISEGKQHDDFDNYVIDKSIPSFKLVGYKELKSGEHVLSIENAKSESGTPCTFALHEGAFYIKSCSL